jgi:hypothetical protein
MKNKPPRTINVLRPKDKSLEAYRAWMKGIASQLAPEAEIEWTEEQWKEKWTNYWQKQEKRSNESGPDNANAE